jgi:hypothetical protein
MIGAASQDAKPSFSVKFDNQVLPVSPVCLGRINYLDPVRVSKFMVASERPASKFPFTGR